MLTIKVHFANGDSLVTGFNGTTSQANAYYVGNVFQLGLSEDTRTRATRIEIL